MKNKKTLFVMFFIALLYVYAGCKKEKDIQKSLLPVAGNSHATGQRIDPGDMEDEMSDFIDLTINNNVDHAGDYEGEDALLIIEAALNYHTCMPDSDYYEIAADTFNFELPLVNIAENNEPNSPHGFVLLHENLPELWRNILESAATANERVTFDSVNNPFNIVVDLEFLEYDRESEESTQTAVVQVITWVGNRGGGGSNVGCGYSNSVTALTPGWYQYPCGYSAHYATQYLQRNLAPPCYAPNTCAPYDFYSYISTKQIVPKVNLSIHHAHQHHLPVFLWMESLILTCGMTMLLKPLNLIIVRLPQNSHVKQLG